MEKPHKTYFEKLQDSRWQEKRLRVMEKSGEGGFTCMWCGAGKETGVTLHVDHGYYKRGAAPWEYDEDTLWCLCAPCHQEAGQLREEVHRLIARMHPAYLKTLGMYVAETVERLEPSRRTVRPSDGPIHCARCGKHIGRYAGVIMTFLNEDGTPGKSFDDIYKTELATQSGLCPHCSMDLKFEDSDFSDGYFPSMPAHAQPL